MVLFLAGSYWLQVFQSVGTFQNRGIFNEIMWQIVGSCEFHNVVNMDEIVEFDHETETNCKTLNIV